MRYRTRVLGIASLVVAFGAAAFAAAPGTHVTDVRTESAFVIPFQPPNIEVDKIAALRPAIPPTTTTTETPPTAHTTPPKASRAAPVVETPTAEPERVEVAGTDVWARLRQCESGGNYADNTGNGYYGAYQFSYGTWQTMGTGYERADLAPPEVQDDAAMRLQAQSGWGQWPACSRKLGLR